MTYEQLERLAKNPYYKLNQQQLEELEEYRRQRYQPPATHSKKPIKHSTSFTKHNPKLEEEEMTDESTESRTNRN